MTHKGLPLQVRAKYMTLDPAANRYVKYIRNIRTIQVSHLSIPLLLYAMLFCQVRFLDTNPPSPTPPLLPLTPTTLPEVLHVCCPSLPI